MECSFCTDTPVVRVYLVPPLVAAATDHGLKLRHDGANVGVCADCAAFVAEECIQGLCRRFVATYAPVWDRQLGPTNPRLLYQLAERLLAQFLRYRSDAVLQHP